MGTTHSRHKARARVLQGRLVQLHPILMLMTCKLKVSLTHGVVQSMTPPNVLRRGAGGDETHAQAPSPVTHTQNINVLNVNNAQSSAETVAAVEQVMSARVAEVRAQRLQFAKLRRKSCIHRSCNE